MGDGRSVKPLFGKDIFGNYGLGVSRPLANMFGDSPPRANLSKVGSIFGDSAPKANPSALGRLADSLDPATKLLVAENILGRPPQPGNPPPLPPIATLPQDAANLEENNSPWAVPGEGPFPRNTPRKVFFSHHSSDAAALAAVRERLEMFGLKGFLAHEDIRSGEPYVREIENALRESDAFLYVGSNRANASPFCQQEIGMAKGLGKDIITSMIAGSASPDAFVEHMQAIRYRAINTGFADRILEELWKSWEPDALLTRCYSALEIRGFSTHKKAQDLITLQSDGFNDSGFQTLFHLHYRGNNCGWARIGYIGQEPSTGQNSRGIATSGKLPDFFPYLDFPFFSQVRLHDDFRGSKNAIKGLLNDIGTLPEDTLDKLAYEDVFENSINYGL